VAHRVFNKYPAATPYAVQHARVAHRAFNPPPPSIHFKIAAEWFVCVRANSFGGNINASA
jgi:hypothetical protein